MQATNAEFVAKEVTLRVGSSYLVRLDADGNPEIVELKTGFMFDYGKFL